MRNFPLFLCAAVSFMCTRQLGTDEDATAPRVDPMVTFDMYSTIVQDTIVVDVSLPGRYWTDTTSWYPVLYLTDGYWRREQHAPIHAMATGENVKEMIIVGIGYPASYDPNTVRVRDLIRSPDKFLSCILKELIPRIEREYRATSERTLWGSSYGGFFALYTLFNYAEKAQGVFQNYIVASPAALEKAQCGGDETDLFGFERILFMKSAQLNANLYITVGGNEEPYRFLNPFNQLVDVPQGRHYTGFFMKSFIDPGKDHYTVWEPTLYEGVRIFLKKWGQA